MRKRKMWMKRGRRRWLTFHRGHEGQLGSRLSGSSAARRWGSTLQPLPTRRALCATAAEAAAAVGCGDGERRRLDLHLVVGDFGIDWCVDWMSMKSWSSWRLRMRKGLAASKGLAAADDDEDGGSSALDEEAAATAHAADAACGDGDATGAACTSFVGRRLLFLAAEPEKTETPYH